MRKMATMEERLVWFGGGFTMGTLFLDGWTCIWHIDEGMTIKKSLSVVKKQKRNFFTYFELYTRQFCLVCIYLLQSMSIGIGE